MTVLLQNATVFTNYENFITKCDSYYKTRRLLQIATLHGDICGFIFCFCVLFLICVCVCVCVCVYVCVCVFVSVCVCVSVLKKILMD